jgi:hypothetical protein
MGGTMPQNLDDWIARQYCDGELSCTATVEQQRALDALSITMTRIAELLGTDNAGLQVHEVFGWRRPLIGFDSPRLSVRILPTLGSPYVVSVKILDGKPAGHGLIELIERFNTKLGGPINYDKMPEDSCFVRRSHPEGALAFTEFIPNAFWLHTFFYVLIRELAQY